MSVQAFAQVKVLQRGDMDAFPLNTPQSVAPVILNLSEDNIVKKVVGLFCEDEYRVTGRRPNVFSFSSQLRGGKNVVIPLTLDKDKRLEKMLARAGLDVNTIRHGWERYMIRVVSHPCKGVAKALVIVGSDSRGTAYGLLKISELMGVSPFYWWSDLPVRKRQAVYISGTETSTEPSVRYRGLFINDEDWGLKPWAAQNFEKDLGDIGPRTYSKVCELILRLKGNMLAPAMHACTGAFYSHPESKLVADSFGIVVTTSHCEPLLINTASKWEWDTKRDGDWNYKTNSKTILHKWDARLSDASKFENVYTMGMRGLHDAGLRGNLPMKERVSLLNNVINDQRALLKKHLGKPIDKIPQIFVPYKETLDVYEEGLRVPDDVTLVWVDDNYGYMKRVSNPQEQKRSGGSGVYYHISYLGAPHDYLWLATTPPALMYEELMKVYHTGGNRYWLLNVGDIKPGELEIKTFFDLAYQVKSMDEKTINYHQSNFLAHIFGEAYRDRFKNILDSYYRLAWSRKPEFMGWEREWDSKEYTGLKDTEYSFDHYSEAQRRLDDYEHLSDEVSDIMTELPADSRAAFYELIGYPCMASYQMNRKFLMSQLNHKFFAKGRAAEANWAARQMEQAHDSINKMNHTFNSMLNGKWRGIMALAPGWCALYQNKPNVYTTPNVDEKPVDTSARPYVIDSCFVLNLTDIHQKTENYGHKIQLIEGMGQEGIVLRLGCFNDKPAQPDDTEGDRVTYLLPEIDADSVQVMLSTVPVFPLYTGRHTAVGVSVDNCRPQVFDNQFKEYGKSWKDQVLRNAAIAHMKFAIDRRKARHTISFICGDPGIMIQKVIIDWGGLKGSYLGPESAHSIFSDSHNIVKQ